MQCLPHQGATWSQLACLAQPLQAPLLQVQHVHAVEEEVGVADKTLGQLTDAGLLCLLCCHAPDIHLHPWFGHHGGEQTAMPCRMRSGCCVTALLGCYCYCQSYACLKLMLQRACCAAVPPSHHQSAVRIDCQVCLCLLRPCC